MLKIRAFLHQCDMLTNANDKDLCNVAVQLPKEAGTAFLSMLNLFVVSRVLWRLLVSPCIQIYLAQGAPAWPFD